MSSNPAWPVDHLVLRVLFTSWMTMCEAMKLAPLVTRIFFEHTPTSLPAPTCAASSLPFRLPTFCTRALRWIRVSLTNLDAGGRSASAGAKVAVGSSGCHKSACFFVRYERCSAPETVTERPPLHRETAKGQM